jgi:hypothetical protein
MTGFLWLFYGYFRGGDAYRNKKIKIFLFYP